MGSQCRGPSPKIRHPALRHPKPDSAGRSLGALPQFLQLLDAELVHTLAVRLHGAFHLPKSGLEAVDGAPQSVLGIGVEKPGKIDQREQQVAELLTHMDRVPLGDRLP